MSALTSLARVQAVASGSAQPVATVGHVHLSARPLVFVPLGMAGEAHAPLAAMAGDDPRHPRLLVVAQPRNRDQRFAFAAELAEVVLPYIEGFTGSEEEVRAGRDGQTRTRFADAPQILVPSLGGIEFARLLGRSTRFRRTSGDYAVASSVPLLGRWLSFFAESAINPGSCLLMAATEMLSRHWATGQSSVEDQNLAVVMAWIDPPAGSRGAAAATAAENPLTWPPAGPATDPSFDNEVLGPLMAAYQRAGSDRARDRVRASLTEALAGQLAPTWKLMWRAVSLLRAMPPAGHVPARWDADKDAFTSYAAYLDEGGFPQPRRDSAVMAARRLNRLERTAARFGAQLAFDDPLIMAEYRLAGEAFAGTVVAVEPGRTDDTGPRRKLRPLITVRTADPVLLDPGATVTDRSRPAQKARILTVPGPGDQPGEVVLELSGGMGRSLTAAPGSVPEIGDRVCYSTLTDDYQPSAEFPPAEETPWTHGGPPAAYLPRDEDTTEEWS